MVKRQLRCQVNQGMFSDELAVTYQNQHGTKKSVFVPARLVKQSIVVGGESEPVEGEVEVDAFHKNGVWWAVLPNDRRDIILVEEQDFVTP